MFISEFENKERLCTAIAETCKNGDARKSKFQEITWIIWDEW